MLATVPMRCMSSAVGSATSASRCIRMPTWRWSRIACCAAAIDFGRPSVIGRTRPGNSTVLRTGTMISASAGTGASVPAPPFGASFASISASATARTRFAEGDHEAAVGDRPARDAVTAGRQPQPPKETTLGQFQPVDDRGAQSARIAALAPDHQVAVLDDRLDLFGIDAGQRDQHQNLAFGLENVDRWLPRGLPRL